MHILGTLINRLVPGQTSLLIERSHGVNQLIHLRTEQQRAIPGLHRLDLMIGADIPVLNGNLIGGTMHRQPQIVDLTTDDQIERIDRRPVLKSITVVGRAVILDDDIQALTTSDEIGIVAQPTAQRIVAHPTDELIFRIVARQCVVQHIPGRIDRRRAHERKVFEI